MASKNKKQLLKKESTTSLVLLSIAVGILALLQNKYGRLSDIRSFYGLHFFDGQHIWPFSEKTLLGETKIQHPVEYPALTGLVMWLLSFFVSPSVTAPSEYYRITAGFQIVLFTASAYLIYKLVGKKYAFYFILAPAVLYSLNRNWDIWAIASMLLSIYLFEKKRFQLSAFLLSVSIATKFFPIVLMLPIMIIFLRNKQITILLKYTLTTLVSWLIINLPFALINFDGWAYFYKFSAERGLGSASFYEITSIIIPIAKFNSLHFYTLNLITALMITYFFIKLKSIPNLAATSFFVMFGFILFNKQYSMQYVVWLSALAVISMAYIKKEHRDLLIYVYVFWQASELAFQYSYFQKILTDAYANSATPMTITVSNTTYAYIGVIRYFLAVIFALLLARFLYLKNSEDLAMKAKSGL
jgi:uncharacterized membrane protein